MSINQRKEFGYLTSLIQKQLRTHYQDLIKDVETQESENNITYIV